MLKSLSIKNYALIDSLIIDFNKDLNILTGETGAGKSILLGAIGLIIGQRADSSVLRDKSEKCASEGVFDIRNYGMQNFFEENDLDYSETTILRREITPQGKSRAFINDTPVNVRVLHDLGVKLIDIHSQHQNLELNEKNYQLRLVDLVAGNAELLKNYTTCYKNYLSLRENLNKVLELAEQSKKDLDYYEFQFRQLHDARLVDGEQSEHEALLEKLTHAEEIKSVFGLAYQVISEDERSVLAVIKENLGHIGKLRSVLPEAEQLFNRLETVYIELKDIAAEALVIEERAEDDPGKAEEVSQRLDLIYSLQQKHRVASVAELLLIQADFQDKIQLVSSYEQEIENLRGEILVQERALTELSVVLRSKRESVASAIENKVIDVLRNVGIPNTAFQIRFGELSSFSFNGLDEVSFMFSANKNQDLQEIGKIASGGEMSRLMLAIKTLITDTQALPTIIFDEIDTGVSGEVAVKMGQILEQMSATVQVLNITHLPQIAAKGKHHYKVYKFDQDDQTFTSIRKLTAQERVEEIAQMLSGENYSATAMETARELLQ
ncbi:MAG: DNA repair protein RecN [Prolixibacteraceae bacterium]|nr:DNA repair protein RecN [Prolixibacteraceae bacterium]